MTLAPFARAAYAAEEEEDSKAKPPPEFEYVELKPLVLPIITERGLTQQVSLLVSLEIPYGKGDEIRAMAPKLADAYISDLYGALGNNEALLKGGVVDVTAIKERLSADTIKVLGPDKVHEVLLQVMQQAKR
ncbi:MAG: flagellar basal body-associated FliL family protein [Alphaproteobacteria bacterium]|nr:MAG: flagellar basal body-associated FliL family protein [Alphaproteobacteria bacterium]